VNLLTAGELEGFAMKALTTWGDADDLRRLLPRVLELIATEDPFPFQVETVFGKLRLGGWMAWPGEEREALGLYFDAIWRDSLANAEDGSRTSDLLCALGRAVEELQPFLKIWENCLLASGYGQLVEFMADGLSNSFWTEAKTQCGQVVGWLTDPETERRLTMIFNRNIGTAFADPLARAIDQLSRFRGTYRFRL